MDTTGPVVKLSPLRSDGSSVSVDVSLDSARSSSAVAQAWHPSGRILRSGRPPQLTWPALFAGVVSLALVSGGVGYAISEGRPRSAAQSGGVVGAVSASATETASVTASNSGTATSSHTLGVSASGTGSTSLSSTASPSTSASPTSVPTRSTEPSPTSASGVAAAVARLMVSGPRTSFLALGDWGRCATNEDPPGRRNDANCERQRGMVPNLEEWATLADVDFIMSTGDQFYDGPWSDVDLRYQYSWREVYNTPTLRAKKWYMIHGNHDYSGDLGSQLRWGERAPHAGGEEWDVRWHSPSLNYSLVLPLGSSGGSGQCLFLNWIDTVPFIDTYRNSNTGAGPTRSPSTNLAAIFFTQLEDAVPGDQLAWLSAALRNASQSCVANVVVGHHAVYGSGQHARSMRQQDLKTRLAFPSVFAYLGVDAYFNGHDHLVEHCLADGGSGGAVTTNYITTGAGSDVRTNNVKIPESRFLLADNGFVVSSFNATHQSHIFVDGDGAAAYSLLQPLNAKLRSGGTGAAVPTVPWFAGGSR